jgi:PilZ domain
MSLGFGPSDAVDHRVMIKEGAWVTVKTPPAERRCWPRLPLAIPVFIRSYGEADRELLEFATALNVSAGGMLLAVRRSIPASAQVSLEIPSAPLATTAALPKVARNLRAKVLRMQHGEGYNLVALKFSRPLLVAYRPARTRRRKLRSSV